MTKNRNLNALFMTKIEMIMHFTCYKSICTHCYSLVQQKITGTTTKGNSMNRTRERLIMLQTLYTKHRLNLLQKIN